MHRNFMAFGAGIRMCIGMNLALQEIKLVVSNIYLSFETSVPPDFDDARMAMADKYTSHPVGHSLPLIFSPSA
jgi:unspecific monooxygenase